MPQSCCIVNPDGNDVINSLSRGLQILHLLAQANRPLGVTDIAERLSVDPSTSYRLLVTLENQGFIRQQSSNKKYTLGFGVVAIASALLRQLDVATVAPPHLRALMARTGESAHLAVADGDALEIAGGVNAGEMVVARAAAFLRPGDRVTAVPAATEGATP